MAGIAEYYAPRSMVAYKLTLNERMHPANVVFIDDVMGTHIGKLFERFCIDSTGQLIGASTTGKYLQLERPQKTDDGILVSLLSGRAGDNRKVYDITSTKHKFDLNVQDAPMVSVRALLSWRGTGRKYAIMCIEHSSNAAGDTILFNPFKNYLLKAIPNVVINFEPVIEAEALDSFVSLEKVEIRRYLGQSDRVDQLTREGDYISYVLSHKRGRPFSIQSVKDIIKEKTHPSVLFGYKGTPLDDNESKILITLKDSSGRKRTFDIYDDYGMKVMEQLSPAGHEPLPDCDFIEICNERCETISARLGRTI